ncbi:hypothetical protein SAMN05421876_101152 [Kaistella jeonii]|nr:hypothetical protein SAMN05421876_101152 [Kaistella jeonii]VEI94751.1 Uncharacterised protein [Kaistella jeonii]
MTTVSLKLVYWNQNFLNITRTIKPIPTMAISNKISAANSNLRVHILFSLLIEAKERITEKQSRTATILVNSSKTELLVEELMCKEVITIRQKPNRFDAVGKICCEVLFDIELNFKSILRAYRQAF